MANQVFLLNYIPSNHEYLSTWNKHMGINEFLPIERSDI